MRVPLSWLRELTPLKNTYRPTGLRSRRSPRTSTRSARRRGGGKVGEGLGEEVSPA